MNTETFNLTHKAILSAKSSEADGNDALKKSGSAEILVALAMIGLVSAGFA